ncbi:MAG: hypothetical protein ACFB0Z_07565 [Candidatus Phaeomarinobacter sp.]
MTRAPQTDDFASAVMMRLVAAGLARQRISIPVPPPSGAHVPRTTKRDVPAEVMETHGPIAILRIGDAARYMPPEPVVQALKKARGLEDMMSRWHRLERFSHGRHAIVSKPRGDLSFTLRHTARDAGPPPSMAETLLVISVLAALAEQVTGQHVRISDTDGTIRRSDGEWTVNQSGQIGGEFLLSGRRDSQQEQRPVAIAATSLTDDLR